MRRKKLQSGFTISETLLSVFLIGSAATIVGATMPVASVSKSKAMYTTLAANYAQKQIEQIKVLEYGNLTPARLLEAKLIDSVTPISGTTYAMTTVDSEVSGNIAKLLPSGTATLTVTQPNNELKQIEINISWSERGKARSYKVGTLVANL